MSSRYQKMLLVWLLVITSWAEGKVIRVLKKVPYQPPPAYPTAPPGEFGLKLVHPDLKSGEQALPQREYSSDQLEDEQPERNYGLPEVEIASPYAQPEQDYGLPMEEYAPHIATFSSSENIYGLPTKDYDQPNQEYGLPELPYAQPKPAQNFGVSLVPKIPLPPGLLPFPLIPQQPYLPPSPEYGPPLPTYGVPHDTNVPPIPKVPQSEYGIPINMFIPYADEYGPPQEDYGLTDPIPPPPPTLPPKPLYIPFPPIVPNTQYGLPAASPISEYGLPQISSEYGVQPQKDPELVEPAPEYLPLPEQEYGLPPPKPAPEYFSSPPKLTPEYLPPPPEAAPEYQPSAPKPTPEYLPPPPKPAAEYLPPPPKPAPEYLPPSKPASEYLPPLQEPAPEYKTSQLSLHSINQLPHPVILPFS